MSEQPSNFSNLESELRQLVPGVPAGNLAPRIAAALKDSPTAWADRFLMGAISTGIAASVVVVAMITLNVTEGRSQSLSAPTHAEVAVVAQTREYLAQLALGHETPSPHSTTAPN